MQQVPAQQQPQAYVQQPFDGDPLAQARQQAQMQQQAQAQQPAVQQQAEQLVQSAQPEIDARFDPGYTEQVPGREFPPGWTPDDEGKR